VQLSKGMARILRHRGATVMRHDGYLPLACLLPLVGPDVTEEDVRRVIRTDTKQRFSLLEDAGTLYVRANQGHTLSDDVLCDAAMLRPIPLAALRTLGRVVHGTYFRAWQMIQQSGGLKPMRRRHVHFARGTPGEARVVSGMRQSCEVYVWIDCVRAFERGVRFWESSNGVILASCEGSSDTVPLDCVEAVENRSGKTWKKPYLFPE